MSARFQSLAAALALLACAVACRSSRPTEFVNVSFRAAVDTSRYETFRIDEAASRSFDDPRVDDELVHRELVAAIVETLEARGYRRAEPGDADCSLFYELWVAGFDEEGRERLRGRIFVRDEEQGRLAWRGERKALAGGTDGTEEGTRAALREFAMDLLRYFPPQGAPH